MYFVAAKTESFPDSMIAMVVVLMFHLKEDISDTFYCIVRETRNEAVDDFQTVMKIVMEEDDEMELVVAWEVLEDMSLPVTVCWHSANNHMNERFGRYYHDVPTGIEGEMDDMTINIRLDSCPTLFWCSFAPRLRMDVFSTCGVPALLK